MKAIWLTQGQLNDALLRMEQVKSDLTVFELALIPNPSEINIGEASTTPAPLVRHFLRFQKSRIFRFGVSNESRYTWVLITPVQVVPEWLAREMQSINE